MAFPEQEMLAYRLRRFADQLIIVAEGMDREANDNKVISHLDPNHKDFAQAQANARLAASHHHLIEKSKPLMDEIDTSKKAIVVSQQKPQKSIFKALNLI